jgi:hypothetical protein
MTYFIDEVGSFDCPASWDIITLDLNLFGEDVVTDLFPAFADIRSLRTQSRKITS